MGCSGHSLMEPGTVITIYNNSFKCFENNVYNNITSYLSNKNTNNIHIGIYSSIIYEKRKYWKNAIKTEQKKIFTKPINAKFPINPAVVSQIMADFFITYPQYIKYDDLINENPAYFTPSDLFNKSFSSLFKKLNIDSHNSKTSIAICFINNNFQNNENEKFNSIKQKFPKNFYLYEINNNYDEFSSYDQYTLFFKEGNIHYWLPNDFYSLNNFNKLMSFNQKENSTTNEKYTKLRKSNISNFLENHTNLNDDYILIDQEYQIFDKTGNILTNVEFPICINTKISLMDENIFIINEPKNKINLNNLVVSEITQINKNIKINYTEIFKEREISLLTKYFFVSKKRYSIFIYPLEKKILLDLISKIKSNINKKMQNINKNYFIENLVILPDINTKFNLYENGKKIYVVLNYSSCFEYVYQFLKNKYKEIFGDNLIKFICIYSIDDDIRNKEELSKDPDIQLTNNYSLPTENNNVNFYVYSFIKTNYFSHILILVNEQGIVTYTTYFKNRAAIPCNYLTKENTNLKEDLPLINKDDIKNIKNFFESKYNYYIHDDNENFINDYNTIFNNNYKKNIFYQPYLSLKYNKIMKDNSKKYKNYSMNFINYENESKTISYNENEHQCLNEISHVFYGIETYISLGENLRCGICCKKVGGYHYLNDSNNTNNQILKFYFCHVLKQIFCEDCYHEKENCKDPHPFNFTFISCKDKNIISHIPKQICSLFRDKEDSKSHNELKDESCDICSCELFNNQIKNKNFYVFINKMGKNPFLICGECFRLLNDEKRSINLTKKYEYLSNFVKNNYIDLDNLIFKKVEIY